MIRLLAIPAVFIALLLSATTAAAQEKARPASDELDVTMQIIVDPDAKLPDEVVRRIPLPARKPETQPAVGTPAKPGAPETTAKGQEHAREAQELGKEMSERAKERAQEANEQREQARRSIADEKRKNPDPPEHPTPPKRPPR
jgi:hypothetical protein